VAKQCEENETLDTKVIIKAEQDARKNRIALPLIIKDAAHLISQKSITKVLDFFITTGCQDKTKEVYDACLETALTIISAKGETFADEILRLLEKYIINS
jgi:hypothetical protein